jgi:NAD(P)-dependent dehydrogenase (short-subunit alcohol dehydrogenase family)
MDRYRVDGSTALVTGAGSGIGRATAVLLAQLGASIVCVDVNADGLDGTLALVAEHGGRAEAEIADVSATPDVERVMARADALGAGLSIVANIAGVLGETAIADTDDAEFDRVLAVNLRGVFLCCREAVRVMRPHRAGSIVNLSSAIVARAVAGYGPYAVSKGGVVTLTKALAAEHCGDGIRVNAIAPGFVVSPMTVGRHPREEQQRVADSITANIPLKRAGAPEDIAYAVAYLASDASAYMTGQTLHINGGTVMP